MKNYGALQNGSDIRGVAMAGEPGKPVDLTPEAVIDLTLAFVLWLAAKTEKKREELTVAVGRDSRLTGPELSRIVCETLAGCGVQVLCCGMASTPAMYMATVFPEVAADGAIMITASHLPKYRNGFKYFSSEGGLTRRHRVHRGHRWLWRPLRHPRGRAGRNAGFDGSVHGSSAKLIADGLGAWKKTAAEGNVADAGKYGGCNRHPGAARGRYDGQSVPGAGRDFPQPSAEPGGCRCHGIRVRRSQAVGCRARPAV